MPMHPENHLPAFAVKLKSLRETAGLTQSQLARKTGLHLGAVFKLEQGKREPAWATVQILAAALGVSCEAFAEEVKLPEPEPDPPTRPRGRPPKGPPTTPPNGDPEAERQSKPQANASRPRKRKGK
jgi:transcriptional regulator with XRE-family HTH domain